MLGQSLLKLIAPEYCRGCRRPGSVVCLNCLREELSPTQPQCYECGWGTAYGQVCFDCERLVWLDGTTTLARYDGLARDLVLATKGHLDRPVGQAAGALLARRLLAVKPRADLVTCVPTSPRRHRERGHNPAALIAQSVARQLNVPFLPVLGRLTSTHQIGHDRQQRQQQIQGAFYVRRARHVRGLNVLVVDDVLTTGATLAQTARVLKEAGAVAVWGAAIARR